MLFFLKLSFSFNFCPPHLPVNSCQKSLPCLLQRKLEAISHITHKLLPLSPHLDLCPFCSPPISQTNIPSLIPLVFTFPELSIYSFHTFFTSFTLLHLAISFQSRLEPLPLTPYCPLTTDLPFSFFLTANLPEISVYCCFFSLSLSVCLFFFPYSST